MADVDFRAAALMDEARAQSGLGDFGEDNFRPALATFVKACLEDSYVDPAGLPDIAAAIVRILVNLLLFEELLKRNSRIRRKDVGVGQSVSLRVDLGGGRN